jgi:hypothetical protein
VCTRGRSEETVRAVLKNGKLVLGTAQHLLAGLTLALCIMGVLSALRLEAHDGVNAVDTHPTPPSVGRMHASISNGQGIAMCIIAAERVHAEREGGGRAVKDL